LTPITSPTIMRPVRATRAWVTALFFLSGSIALIYEVVWTRQMVLLVGASTPAVSTVLGVFMAGLAVGGFAFGGLSDRSSSPLKLYGLLEAGVGAYALALPAMIHGVTPAYVRAAQALQGEPVALGLLRVLAGFALLGLPTALMGGTLPALLRVVATHPARLGVDLGRLYTANLLGGVAGTLAAAFVFIGFLGMRGTVVLAALGNLTIALAALLWPGVGGSMTPAPATPLEETLRPTGLPPDRVLLTIIFLSGFLTMGYEVLWTRVLVFSLLSTVYAFAVILAIFLLGLMLGGMAFTLAERKQRLGPETLCLVQVAAALFALGLAPLGSRVKEVVEALSLRVGFTGAAFVLAMAAGSALLMLIPATLMGLVFPLATRLLIPNVARSGTLLGRAYWINTVGAVAGALLTGFAIIPALGLKGGLVLLAGMQVVAGTTPVFWTRRPRAHRIASATLAAGGLGLVLALVSHALAGPSPFERTPADRVLAHREDATASVSVVASPSGGRSLFIDGFEAASADARSGYMAMMGYLPMLLHSNPERALVVCFGTGTTAGSVLRSPDVRVDIVDINRTVFDFAEYFRDVNHGAAHDPRGHLVVEDGRSFLTTSTQSYDVITSEPMPPTFAGVSNLYSREYYALARAHLRPGGLVVQWLPFHLVTAGQAWSILRSVQDVFPETTLWIHDDTGIVIARRDGAVTIDPQLLAKRLAPIASEMRRFGVADLDALLGMYALGPSSVAALTRGVTAVTDDRPSLEYHGPRHSLARSLGVYSEDQLQALVAVYTLRSQEPLPLVGASPADASRLALRRIAETHALLGDVYLGAGSTGHAREEYDKGLATRPEPLQRAQFLFALAQVARDEGNIPEALQLLDQVHALGVDDSAAMRLRETLAPQTPASR
jgi:spermidine synthase